MTSPYATLLEVRRIEEKQAEAAFAEAQREVLACHRLLQDARGARAAWLEESLESRGERTGAGLGILVTSIERAERDAEARLARASQRLAAGRHALLEAQRRREAVQKLHVAVLQAQARAEARRMQAELDDLAGIGAGRRETRS